MNDIHQAMNCESVELPSKLKREPEQYCLEPKFDGFRLVCEVTEDGADVAMYTREGKRQDGKLPHIDAELGDFFPIGTVLDGEIVALQTDEEGLVSNHFDYVQSVMLSKPERARQVQEDNRPLHYVIFDMMRFAEEDVREMPLKVRKDFISSCFIMGNQRPKYIGPAVMLPCNDETHQALVDAGYEGSIAKDLESPYISGGRGLGWYKIKATWTVDVTILDFTPGDGKYKDTIGAVIFGQMAPEGAVAADAAEYAIDGTEYVVRGQCSGMTDAVRRSFLDLTEGVDNRMDFIGQTMELQHMGLMHGGVKFRHPQFKRFRPEKPREQVTWHDR